jgi:predicted glycosyltransferase
MNVPQNRSIAFPPGSRSSSATPGTKAASATISPKSIWIDLDNSPHVPFFAPIIKELEDRGHAVLVTARDFAQVTQLIRLMKLRCTTIGRHYGKNTVMKIVGVAIRASQLAPLVRRAKPDLAVSHGSRAQLLLSAMLRVPSMDISDYEHATDFKGFRPTWMMVPELIPRTNLGMPEECVLSYPGIKEDVYVPQFAPNPDFLTQLKLSNDSILVTLRPPASHAHYHNPESDVIFAEVMNWLVAERNVVTILLPRTEAQGREIRKQWPTAFDSGKVIVPAQAVDGLNLMWHSDLVISGGGTMNREAAALRLPVYSTFRGKIGAVDNYLVAQQRLILIDSKADVRVRIKLEKRQRHIESYGNTATLNAIVQQIESVMVRA